MSLYLTSLSGRLRMLRQAKSAFGLPTLALSLRALAPAVAFALASTLAFTACGGGGGGSSSSVATPLSIGTQPANASAAVGATATFTVVASGGTAPYTYQWSKTPKGSSAAALAGATSASFTTPALTIAEDGASFTVTVKDATNASVTSNAATLTVTPPASHLAVTLADQTVASGATATFTPVVTNGKEPYTYVWKKGGTVIPGATGATYTTAATTSADDSAQYFVSVTDSATPASTATATAVLHVTAPPLTTLLNAKLSPAPSITFLLRKSNGDLLDPSSVQVNQQISVPGGHTVGSISSVASGTSGHFRPQTYPIRLMGDSAQHLGARLENLTVSQDATLTYQTSKQSWVVTLKDWASKPASGQPFHQPLRNYQVNIYQCDSEGLVAWDRTGFASPLVLSVTGLVDEDAKTLAFDTELFKGTYRAVFIPKYDTTISAGIPVCLSAPFTAAGDGTSENQTLTLPDLSGIKSLTLKLNPKASVAPFSGGEFSVELRDKTSQIPLGSRILKDDSTVAFTTNLTDVIAVVTDLRLNSPSNGRVVAIHPYTGLTADTPMATLTQYNVKGQVTGPVSIPTTAKLNVSLHSGQAGANWDLDPGYLVFPITLTKAPAFGLDLFEGDWSLSADTNSIRECPDGPTVSFTLSADKTDADIAIPAGGTISGTLLTKAGAPVESIRVDLVDPATLKHLKSTLTGSDGKYVFYVPFGTTYNLVANADAYLPAPLVATNAAPAVTRDLVQYTAYGRVTDGTLGIQAKIQAGPGLVSAQDGTFTLNLFEGLNYIWIEPQDKSSNLGPALFTNVLVSATTAP
ncbi:MAG: SprB repeat-containing protein [Acidobacteria bacterium]|nr:SprB repeat-containing protein [Acidobacteriota bacterium]MBI3490114.1 SprB repeat-containing protein [Acidobacteriota bacterium]